MKKKAILCFFAALIITISTLFSSAAVKADTPKKAALIKAGTYKGEVSKSNKKYYKVNLDSAGEIIAFAESTNGGIHINVLDEKYRVMNYSGFTYGGTEIVVGNHYAFKNEAEWSLQEGTYYIEVNTSSENKVSYEFDISFKLSNETYSEKTNNDAFNYNPLPFGKVIRGWASDQESANNDYIDIYQFTLKETSVCDIKFYGYNSFEAGETDIYILDENDKKVFLDHMYDNTTEKCVTNKKIKLSRGTYRFCVVGPSWGCVFYKFKINTFTAMDRDVNGLFKKSYNNEMGWYYVTNGMIYLKKTGIVKCSHNDKYYYVEKGRLTFDKTGLVKGTINGKTGYWHVKDSRVKFDTTLVKFNGKYYAVFDGLYDSTRTAIVKYNNSYWYVKKGKLQSDFTGKVKIKGKNYNIVKGKVKK